MASITLYHCNHARSFRVLWTMHELGLKNYRLVTMPFPPRFTVPDYPKLVNVLGTIPCFLDGDTKMTESCGAPMYLVEKYGPTSLRVLPEEPDFGAYLNWITHADATITFPQTVYMRFALQEAQKGWGAAGEAYAKWFIARLRLLDKTLEDGREYLCAGRFTIADICVHYALDLAVGTGIAEKFGPFKPRTQAYLDRLKLRPCYESAVAEEQASLAAWEAGQSKL
eukprot:TRINITY_DN31777_c0_g1_i1.p1 TRINITY_DN31777_c0_g1~~TRINITY_DN31777_c0_g1_i1.p1  ORF type:complete len:225 (+),score=19.98 TRINITY_DN31777_c0_g1_i1:74-748(+)